VSDSDDCLRVLRALESANWDGIAAAVGQQVSAKALTQEAARPSNRQAHMTRSSKFDSPSVLLCLSSADRGHQCSAHGHGIPRAEHAAMMAWHLTIALWHIPRKGFSIVACWRRSGQTVPLRGSQQWQALP
jgi:hypothetical protein